jgi:hypothetical protein
MKIEPLEKSLGKIETIENIIKVLEQAQKELNVLMQQRYNELTRELA